METYNITVNFVVSRSYKIRAKNANKAGEILDKRVIKTMNTNNFDNPIIYLTNDDNIKETSKVCDY